MSKKEFANNLKFKEAATDLKDIYTAEGLSTLYAAIGQAIESQYEIIDADESAEPANAYVAVLSRLRVAIETLI